MYISEISRVLTPKGIAFLSTPNRKFTSGKANPYHLKEFHLDELRVFLSQYYGVVELYGQRCTSPVARVYRGGTAARVRRLKEFLRIQFLLPHWAKRMLEFCLIGSTMTEVKVEDFEFVAEQVDDCDVFVAVCHNKDSITWS